MSSYTFTLILLFALALTDICISVCNSELTPLAQLIVQLVLHVFTAGILTGLYMRTVLIALPPSATGTTLWLFLVLNCLRLIFLIIVRVLAFQQVTDRINILFDAFNLVYWWSTFAVSLQLGKSKYYSFRHAFT